MKKIEDPENWWMELDTKLDVEYSAPLSETQTLIQREEKLKFDLDDEYFETLHNRIMDKVAKTDINVDKTETWKKVGRRLQRAVAVFVAVSMFGLSQQTQTKNVENKITETLAIAREVSKPNMEIESLLTHQQKSDFFVDLVAEFADHLTIDQINDLMGERQTN